MFGSPGRLMGMRFNGFALGVTVVCGMTQDTRSQNNSFGKSGKSLRKVWN